MWRGAVWPFIGFLFSWAAQGDCTAAEPTPSFRNEIAPIVQAHCLRCHSGPHPKGELDLSTRAGMLTGGVSGKPAIQPGNAATSLLARLVSEKKMPPKQSMPASEAQLLRLWIDAGAPWDGAPLVAVSLREQRRAGPEWWSLQPIRRPTVPVVSESSRVRNPIDAFILSRLAERRLSLAPEADRRTLIRRVSLDLTGLLLRPEDIEAFCQDPSPVAYEALVDRLLASPHYGERWGRHWLDVVRFAESHGYETNALRTNAWPYRDYVIRAFNADTPLPRFALEQLAGDTLSEGDPLLEAATGFLVGGTHDVVGNATIEGQLQQRMDDLYDMVSTTGSAFLGLTVNCARCHNHKFDPISQKDFYGLQAVFAGVQHAERAMPQSGADQRRREQRSMMYAGTFRPPEPTYLLKRGDPLQKLEMVSPSAIAAVSPSLLIEPTAPEAQRRVALARWIGDPRNPLPSRVMVNRLWHYHFGQGLVRTPSDFGFNGDRPSHPELLNWLAAEFQRQDCRLKPLHRLIVLSSTYRQSSRSEPRARSEDGECRLLWRFPPRRLEAEVIRDTVLQASGSLNRRMGGPGYHLWNYSGYVIVFTPKTTLGPDEFRAWSTSSNREFAGGHSRTFRCLNREAMSALQNSTSEIRVDVPISSLSRARRVETARKSSTTGPLHAPNVD